MKAITCGLCLLLAGLAGCRSRSAICPQQEVAPHRPLRLLYYKWTGSSPGVGFLRTDVKAVEIDFTGDRVRSVVAFARAPGAMLPRRQAAILGQLSAQMWCVLPDSRADEIRRAAAAWLQTDPPKTCYTSRRTGREDGYTERLTLSTAVVECTVWVNPENTPVSRDACSPGPAYQRLIDALFPKTFLLRPSSAPWPRRRDAPDR